MTTTVLISTFPPFPSLSLTLPSSTPLSSLPSYLPDFLPKFSDADLALSLPSGLLNLDSRPLSSLWVRADRQANSEEEEEDAVPSPAPVSSKLVSLRLAPRLLGGKGGFGSQLRAAGGRMSSQKTSNNDSCRDLNGRRLSTIKEAKTLAAYLESEPERVKAQQEARRAKLEKLEKRLGLDANGKERTTDGESSSTGAKRRFDDTEYLEQSRDIVDNVKSAVAAGMLKKRKKAKASPPPDGKEATSSSSSSSKEIRAVEGPSKAAIGDRASGNSTDVTEKVLDSPLTAPVAAAASVSLAAIGA